MEFRKPFSLPSRLGCWLFLAAGCCLLVAGLVSAIDTARFLRRSTSAAGTIVRMRIGHHSDTGSADYAPVFSFTASNGRGYSVESHNFSNPPEFSVGQNIKVLYDRDHPEHARIDTHWQIWAIEEVLGLVGGLFVASGVAFLIYLRRRDRRRLSEAVAGVTSV